MGHKIAIDFGTTNSVVAYWNSDKETSEIITVPGISAAADADRLSLVPSLLYIHDASANKATIGQAVRDNKLDYQKDNRLFRNFKRGIVASPAPEPREIDGVLYADRDAGRSFVRQLLAAIPYQKADIDQLVLTAPVASFEGYLAWLNELITDIAPEKIRIVDESTAAALGYAVTEPGAVVLVFDFGGGTLDLSLVQLPESREKTGGLIQRLLKGSAGQHSAKVIAKAGRIIGGSDIDQWLLAEVLKRTGLSTKDLGSSYTSLLTQCEQAKITLSTVESVDLTFEAGGKSHNVTITRPELEALLEVNGFSSALRRVVDKVMHVAHQRGIFKEDINYVLLVGGTSLMPAVQNILKQYFTDMAVRSDKPFTAVAEGALQVAAGFGLEDYLAHSYGIRHLENGVHLYDEIIPMGSRYPTPKPLEIILSAAHDKQESIEFVIGEIDTDSVSMLEVKYEDGQAVFVAQAERSSQQIIPLNEDKVAQMLAKLIPPGVAGEDRIKAYFSIDDRRQLRLTVTDMATDQTLLSDVVVATLR
ncbi:MAG: Hsp70 family protein [Chloroflexota bacterium]